MCLAALPRQAAAQPTGACCFGSTCVILTEPDCLSGRSTCLGPITTCSQCPALPHCPTTGSLYGLSPADPILEPPAYTSESSRSLRCFEKFSGVAGAVQAV